jgi:hypothetical protein
LYDLVGSLVSGNCTLCGDVDNFPFLIQSTGSSANASYLLIARDIAAGGEIEAVPSGILPTETFKSEVPTTIEVAITADQDTLGTYDYNNFEGTGLELPKNTDISSVPFPSPPTVFSDQMIYLNISNFLTKESYAGFPIPGELKAIKSNSFIGLVHSTTQDAVQQFSGNNIDSTFQATLNKTGKGKINPSYAEVVDYIVK